jgi:hypothetical protein
MIQSNSVIAESPLVLEGRSAPCKRSNLLHSTLQFDNLGHNQFIFSLVFPIILSIFKLVIDPLVTLYRSVGY